MSETGSTATSTSLGQTNLSRAHVAARGAHPGWGVVTAAIVFLGRASSACPAATSTSLWGCAP